MRKILSITLLSAIVFTVTVVLSACAGGGLLSNVQASPSTITPNADGIEDVTRFQYRLGRSANLSIYLLDEDGTRYYFRDQRRRSPGEYRVDFGGVINGAMLPNGTYTWVVEATDDNDQTATQQGSLTIQQADTTKPELQGFSVYPQTFTPNQDGIDDRVDINYYLTKQADVSVYLLGPDDARYPIAEVERLNRANRAFTPMIMKAVLIWVPTRPPTGSTLSPPKPLTR
jgi:hypothetical protein